MFRISLRYLQSRLYFYSSTIRKMSNLLQVEVEQGVLQGTLVDYPLGLPYKSFLGIPYAKPPVGDLRFREPISADHWDGVYDATKAAKISAQFDSYILKKYIGEEDCLYLNIHAPEKARKGDSLPVMFWIHGGSFTIGHGNPDIYGGGHLVQNDVILVTVHYRLGALGFLCLDIEEAAGNMGLKDIALALRWVNKNISAFGGDPNNVTVFGESAGGAATHHIITSPVTEGLYKRAILQSGVGICEWSHSKYVEKSAFELGELLGLKTRDKNELIRYLKNVPVKDLVMTARLIHNETINFGPVVEKNISNVKAFCTKDLRTRLREGDFPKVSIMAGHTSNEGFLDISFMDLEIEKKEKIDLASAVPNMKDMVPRHLQERLDNTSIERAITKIKEFYFHKDDDVLDSFQDIRSDFYAIKDTDHVIKKYVEHVPTYYYNFSYKGALNWAVFLSPIFYKYKGATHTDELGYLFTQNFSDILKLDKKIEPSQKDILIIKTISGLWTNFAKCGDPTPNLTSIVPIKWDPVNLKRMNCMDIGDSLSITDDPFRERVEFWESLEDF